MSKKQYWIIFVVLSVLFNLIRLPGTIRMVNVSDGWDWLAYALFDFPLGFMAMALYEGESMAAQAIIAYVIGGIQWCIWAGCITLIIMGILRLKRKMIEADRH